MGRIMLMPSARTDWIFSTSRVARMSRVPVPYLEKSDREKSCNAWTNCWRIRRLTREAI